MDINILAVLQLLLPLVALKDLTTHPLLVVLLGHLSVRNHLEHLSVSCLVSPYEIVELFLHFFCGLLVHLPDLLFKLI